jgi:chromosome segregation ATPase
MENDAVAWVLAGLLALASVFAWLRVRSEASRVASLEQQAEQLEKELRASRGQLEKRAEAQRRQGDQDAELRRKLDKAKKRAAQARDDQKAEADRAKGLERELALRQADLRSLREEMERGGAGPAAATPRPVVVPPKPDPAELARQEAAAAKEKGEEIAALEARVEQAEAAATRSATEAEEHRKRMERLKGKIATQEKLYVSIRSELEAKKDRLRTQTEELERLRAFKVAVVDPLPEVAAPAADAEAAPAPEHEEPPAPVPEAPELAEALAEVETPAHVEASAAVEEPAPSPERV